jgi:formylmethanofuran dehydrogenase subunit D
MGLRLVLVTGRTLEQAAGMHRGKTSDLYERATRTAEIGREDLEALGLAEGDSATLRTSEGEARVTLKASDLPRGMLFLPLGYCANGLIGPGTEGTGMPSFKGVPAELEP